METLLWIAGGFGGYGAIWFTSAHAMAKMLLNPKNTSIIEHEATYSSNYHELIYRPSNEPLSEAMATEKVEQAFSIAAWKAWAWPVTWPHLLLAIHFGKSRLAHEEKFVGQQIEVKRSILLVQLLNANLDQEPIMAQAARATTEKELEAVEKQFNKLEALPSAKIQHPLGK
jgi:hypothetical protein